MWVKKLLVVAMAFAGVMFGAGEAKATNAYVCNASYIPSSSTRGTQGFVHFLLTTEPQCEGSMVGGRFYFLCSGSATSSDCPSSASYHYERHGLLAYLQGFQRAQESGQLVGLSTLVDCNGSTGNLCAGPIYFGPF